MVAARGLIPLYTYSPCHCIWAVLGWEWWDGHGDGDRLRRGREGGSQPWEMLGSCHYGREKGCFKREVHCPDYNPSVDSWNIIKSLLQRPVWLLPPSSSHCWPHQLQLLIFSLWVLSMLSFQFWTPLPNLPFFRSAWSHFPAHTL